MPNILSDIALENPRLEFPKITFSILNQVVLNQRNDQSSIKFKIIIQESIDSVAWVQEHSLSVVDKSFKTEGVMPFIQSMPYLNLKMESHQCILQMQGMDDGRRLGNIQITILPDENIILNRCSTKGGVVLHVPQKLLLAGSEALPFKSKALSLKAKQIIMQNPLKLVRLDLQAEQCINESSITGKKLVFSTCQEFVNYGVIEADVQIKLNTRGKWINHKVMKAKQRFQMQGSEADAGEVCARFVNKGLLHSEHLRMKVTALENQGHILCEDGRFQIQSEISDLNAVSIRNKGILVGENLLQIKANGRIVNEHGGQWLSKKLINCIESARFINRGEVSCDTLSIRSVFSLKNAQNATMACQKLFLKSQQGNIENSGLIVTQKDASLMTRQLFINHGQCLIKGQLGIIPEGGFQNKGVIATVLGIKIITEGDECFASGSKLTSDQTIDLTTLARLDLGGLVQSNTLITTQSGRDTKVQKEGRVIAKTQLTMTAVKDLQNAGTLSGEQGYLSAVNAFVNEQGASIQMQSALNITAQTVSNAGKVKAGTELNVSVEKQFKQLFGGRFESLETIALKVQGDLCNEGEVEARNSLTLWARDAVRNSGRLTAKTISVQSECLLYNLLTGIILAGEKLNLFSKELLENGGKIKSQGSCQITTDALLKNLKTGTVVAKKDLKLLAGHVLSNAGKIISDDKLMMEAAQWVDNTVTGLVTAEGSLEIRSERIDNDGQFTSQQKLYIKALSILHNHQRGKIHAKETLELLADCALNNEGTLSSDGNLKAEIKFIVENTHSGRITAKDAIELVNALLIQNAGVLQASSAKICAQSLLNNLQSGHIEATQSLKLISEFALKNTGLLVANQLEIQAKDLLSNFGKMRAVESLRLECEGFALNQGICHSDKDLKIHAEQLYNLSMGVISAKETLEIIAKNHLEQQGKVETRDGHIEALTLSNSGSISSLKALSINIQSVFEHCRTGVITAQDAVTVFTHNLQLMGQLMGKGTLDFTVEESFDYGPETLWACQIIRLMLKQGYDFHKPIRAESLHLQGPTLSVNTHLEANQDLKIQVDNLSIAKDQQVVAGGTLALDVAGHYDYSLDSLLGHELLKLRLQQHYGDFTSAVKTPGGFELDIPGAYHAQTETGGDCILRVTSLTTDADHSITAKGQVNIDAAGKLQINKNSNLTGNQGVSLNAQTIQTEGSIYSGADLLLQALYRIENSGCIIAEGNAKIVAPLFTQKIKTLISGNALVADSDAPSLTVAQDCEVKADAEMFGAKLAVGRDYTHRGNFSAHSFESFQRLLTIYDKESITHDELIKRFDTEITVGGHLDIQGQHCDHDALIQADSIDIDVISYRQKAGMVKSGSGGTRLTAESEVQILPQPVISLDFDEQGYRAVPQFVPAHMYSEGHQEVLVTEGVFSAESLSSHALGNNTIIAQEGIHLRPSMAGYELPTEKEDGLSTGGTATAFLQSEITAGGDLKMVSEQEIHLQASLLASGGSTFLAANKLRIVDAEIEESTWSVQHESGHYSCKDTETESFQNTALLSSILAGEDIIMTANQHIQMQGVQAGCGENIILQAPEIDIKGAKESTVSYTETETLSVSFFGSGALESIAQGRSNAALGQLLRQDAFLNAAHQLANAKDGAAVSIHSVQSFIEGFRLASKLSAAYNSNLPGNVLNSLTDRWGLTTLSKSGERFFNPSITFGRKLSSEESESFQVIPTALQGGQSIQLTGDVIRLKDGTLLSAGTIMAAAHKILEISAAENTHRGSTQSAGVSVGVTPIKPGFASLGVEGGRSQSQQAQYQSAQLQAQSISLSSGDKITVTGANIQAQHIRLTAPTVQVGSVQNTLESSGNHWNASVSQTSAGVGFGQQSENVQQTVLTTVSAGEQLSIQADTLHQIGSSLTSAKSASLKRFDGAPGEVNHQVEHLSDNHTRQSTEINVNVAWGQDAFPLLGSVASRNLSSHGTTYATFAAPEVTGSLSPTVNQDANNPFVLEKNHENNVGVAIPMCNQKALQKDVKAIQKAVLSPLKVIALQKPTIVLPKSSKVLPIGSNKAMVQETLSEPLTHSEPMYAGLQETDQKVNMELALNTPPDPVTSNTSSGSAISITSLGSTASPDATADVTASLMGQGLSALGSALVDTLIPPAHASTPDNTPKANPVSVAAGALVGFAKEGLNAAVDLSMGTLSFLQQADNLVDNPNLLTPELGAQRLA